jgi:hypothetical protein
MSDPTDAELERRWNQGQEGHQGRQGRQGRAVNDALPVLEVLGVLAVLGFHSPSPKRQAFNHPPARGAMKGFSP